MYGSLDRRQIQLNPEKAKRGGTMPKFAVPEPDFGRIRFDNRHGVVSCRLDIRPLQGRQVLVDRCKLASLLYANSSRACLKPPAHHSAGCFRFCTG